MKRESFIFYSSWLEAINVLPEEMRGDLFAAIVLYGIEGKMPEQPTPLMQAMLAMVKPQIEANNIRYDNYRKSIENGRLGGRPVKKDANNENPLDNPLENPLENHNVNGNVNDNEKENEFKREAEASTHAPNEDYIKFKEWIRQKAPYCANPQNFPSSQITEAEFLKLKLVYTGQQIAEVIEQIENRKDLRKKYVNLYRTVLNWAKKNYGK